MFAQGSQLHRSVHRVSIVVKSFPHPSSSPLLAAFVPSTIFPIKSKTAPSCKSPHIFTAAFVHRYTLKINVQCTYGFPRLARVTEMCVYVSHEEHTMRMCACVEGFRVNVRGVPKSECKSSIELNAQNIIQIYCRNLVKIISISDTTSQYILLLQNGRDSASCQLIVILALTVELTRYSVFTFVSILLMLTNSIKCSGRACICRRYRNERMNRIQMRMMVHVGKSINVLYSAYCHSSRKHRYFVRKLIDYNKSDLLTIIKLNNILKISFIIFVYQKDNILLCTIEKLHVTLQQLYTR